MDTKSIYEIIFSHFGEYPSAVEKIAMGVMTFKYKVQVNHLDYILRMYPPANTTSVKLEFNTMLSLFFGKCMVPEPVAYNDSAESPYLVYKFIEGKPLSSLSPALSRVQLSSIAAQVFGNIADFSKEEVQGFGFLFTNEEKHDNWQDFLLDAISRGEHYLPSIKEFDASAIVALLDFAKKQSIDIHLEDPCFVWNDFSQDNIIIKDNTLAGFIDFEGCIAGDPVMALGYLFAIEGNSDFFAAMRANYEKRYSVSYERILFYTIIRLFRLSKYIHLSFPTGIKRDPLLVYFKGFSEAVEYVKS